MDKPEEHNRPKTWVSFLRAQLASFTATAVDFLTVIFLTEVLGIWYVASNAIGAFAGTVVNFIIGRYWVFVSTERNITHQALRYGLVSIGSLILNTGGVYLITEYFQINYIYSKIFVSIFIGVFYNFVLQKIYVYK